METTTYVVTVPVFWGRAQENLFWGDTKGSGYTVMAGIDRAKKYKTFAGAERARKILEAGYTDTQGKVVAVATTEESNT